MGNSRETRNVFFYLNPWRYKGLNARMPDFKNFWQIIKTWDKIAYEDSFMPIVCILYGHKSYQPDKQNEPNELACKRCHKYIKIK